MNPNSSALLHFTHLFREQQLPKSEWTHHAHIAVAFVFLDEYGSVEDALPHLRLAIQSYNLSVGTANTDTSGYHETLTFFWLVVAFEFGKYHPTSDLAERYHSFLQSILARRGSPTLFYTRELLFSTEARRTRIYPDILPLSDIETFLSERTQPHFIWDDAEFEQRFANGTLDPALFSHEAHLRLAWIHLKTYGETLAIQHICSQLQQFVTMLNAQDKYHATLTVAAIQMIHHLMKEKEISNFKEFIRTYPQLRDDFKAVIERHYRPNTLQGEQAKKMYIAPDVLPFG